MADLVAWFEAVAQWLVVTVEQLGVLGIFIMTFVESTFVPLPSEVVMIPAGYLIHQGKMSAWLVFPASVLGTIGGAYFNYWLAEKLGRGFLVRYGKYVHFNTTKLEKLERFFVKHGAISTFLGRLIPGIRHYISFPAGLAEMNKRSFLLWTGLGGALWMGILLTLGYFIGANQELLLLYMPWIKVGIGVFILLTVAVYVRRARRK